ncbi:hypothetical protein L6452_02457 [Arctium lappa]|uniref:Uncharacterized protein n=1 Tax=Arctium lappa TaxID=4217 RepID=A0ACB9FKF4_ARCLA|nr:hypothetical protein L6452_02457 [Arctium lappa]
MGLRRSSDYLCKTCVVASIAQHIMVFPLCELFIKFQNPICPLHLDFIRYLNTWDLVADNFDHNRVY